MKQTSNVITINGQKFDSRTGAIVGASSPSQVAARNVDGILPQHRAQTTLASPRPATMQPLTSTIHQPIMDIARVAGKPIRHRTPQPGKTLMRRVVSKPQASLKSKVKVVAPTDALTPKVSASIVPKVSVGAPDMQRLVRANQVAKSKLIQRFPAPTTLPSLATSSAASPKHKTARAAAGHIAVAAQPSIFEKALANATGHLEKPTAKKSHSTSRRLVNVAAASLAVVVLGGFVAYQNIANIKLQVASSHAGFQASLPHNKPAGFSLGGLSYQTGSVDMKFKSNSDNRAFAISQKASSWDSQTLRDSFVSSTVGNRFHTASARGRTVYIYGDNNATWVNGGVWYQVQTHGSLSERQLVDLAASM